jgi:hypothetical protein
MTSKQRRMDEVNQALDKLVSEGHGKASDDANSRSIVYVLDEYGNRYMATHFADFNRQPNIYRPFANSLEEMQCREAANKNKEGKSNG